MKSLVSHIRCNIYTSLLTSVYTGLLTSVYTGLRKCDAGSKHKYLLTCDSVVTSPSTYTCLRTKVCFATASKPVNINTMVLYCATASKPVNLYT